MRPTHLAGVVVACLIGLSRPTVADDTSLADVGTDAIRQDWGAPGVNRSVDGNPLSVGGQPFDKGVGTHANSSWLINLDGHADHFTASVGVDDEVKTAAGVERFGLTFKVVGDGRVLFQSGPMHAGDRAKKVDVSLAGVKMLLLSVTAGAEITYCHADWVGATISYTGTKPVSVAPPVEPAVILTPDPAATPRITGARVFGVRPTHPVLFTVTATGEKPVTFSAEGLPAGITLDPATGRLTGAVATAGEFPVTVHATNARGSADRKLKIVVGDKIALTPPMGWNSWNCFASNVSQEKVQAAADAMVSSGLVDHGWTYINVDDCWEIPSREKAESRRGADGHILTNKKFPDMKAMADYIHSKGLRAGLYSSPGPSTCGGFTASYEFEQQDARQYADWGFDYLKYDWCSYDSVAHKIRKDFKSNRDIEMDQHPYLVMRDALAAQNRDVLFSFCQYGMGDVWKWGEQAGGNCWRTTGDINDSWSSMAGNGFREAGHEQYAGPGHWNDPDMLVVGSVGWGPNLHPTRLTPNEQYTHISLWSLLSSPLLIGCDMTKLDPFTKSLLSNDEVLDINQDPLGKQAARITQDADGREVWAKDMEDGTKAVGLFNRGEMETTVTVKAADLKLANIGTVRDVWRQRDMTTTPGDQFSATVPRHGVVLVRVTAGK